MTDGRDTRDEQNTLKMTHKISSKSEMKSKYLLKVCSCLYSGAQIVLVLLAGAIFSYAIIRFSHKQKDAVTLIQVEGNSMLPTLNGGTVYEICPRCNKEGPRVSRGTSICTNCGWMVPEKERVTPDYIRKSRQTVRFEPLLSVVPQSCYALDDVVVATPNEEIGPVIKRIVGLPGDHLEVRDGMLFRNGKRFVRSLESWRNIRIPVYDDDFRPDGTSRWLTKSLRIVQILDGWRFPAGNQPLELQYAHETGRFVTSEDGTVFCRLEPAPITNFRAENGTGFRSDANAQIFELQCEFTLQKEPSARLAADASASGRVVVSLPSSEGEFLFVLISDSCVLKSVQAELLRESSSGRFPSQAGGVREVRIFTIPSWESRTSMAVCASTLDGIPRLTLDEKPLNPAFSFSFPSEAGNEETASAIETCVSRSVSAVLPDCREFPFDGFGVGLMPGTQKVERTTSTETANFMSENHDVMTSECSVSGTLRPEDFSYPATARIWCWGEETLEIHHLNLFRGEYWENFLKNFHYFSQNEKKTLAFDCNCEYYLVGDNFFVSEDSRQWGAVPQVRIQGKVVLPERFSSEVPPTD